MVTTSHHITIHHDMALLQVRGNLLYFSGVCRAIGEEVMSSHYSTQYSCGYAPTVTSCGTTCCYLSNYKCTAMNLQGILTDILISHYRGNRVFAGLALLAGHVFHGNRKCRIYRNGLRWYPLIHPLKCTCASVHLYQAYYIVIISSVCACSSRSGKLNNY